MGAQRFARIGRLWRGVAAAAVVVLVPVVVAGGGQASAAAGRSGQNAAGASGVASAGGIATVAGGVGGPGKATQVGLPGACGVSLAGGYLYIADGGAVRKVSAGTDGLTTLAGTGAAHGPLGDGGFAAKATIGTCGAVVDVAGNLVLADASNRVRVVAAGSGTFYGQAMTAGHIYSVAGGGTGGLGDGGPATSAKLDFSQCGIQVPSCSGDVAVDAAGNLVIADDGHNRVRVVAASSGTFYGQAMTAGDIYSVAGGGAGGLGDGGPATSAKLSGPSGVAVDGRGNLVIADTGHNRARVVAASTGTLDRKSVV